jgi:hypothetical protein
MDLQKEVIVWGISDLHTARFAAGMGATYCCFAADSMSQEQLQEICQWLQGVKVIVAEPQQDTAYPMADYIALPINTLASDIDAQKCVGIFTPLRYDAAEAHELRQIATQYSFCVLSISNSTAEKMAWVEALAQEMPLFVEIPIGEIKHFLPTPIKGVVINAQNADEDFELLHSFFEELA